MRRGGKSCDDSLSVVQSLTSARIVWYVVRFEPTSGWMGEGWIDASADAWIGEGEMRGGVAGWQRSGIEGWKAGWMDERLHLSYTRTAICNVRVTTNSTH